MAVGRYRLDLAIRAGDALVNVECDGAPFHMEQEQDAERDRALQEKGWTVIRFSGRRIEHRLDDCVREVVDLVAAGPVGSDAGASS